MFQVINTLALVVMSAAVAYFLLAIGLGVRELRQRRIPLSAQSELDYGHPFDGSPDESYWVYFLIACLNEEAVIGETVASLLDPSGRSRIVVVDDGSDDRTGAAATAAGGDQVTVVRRELPDARQGKGAALNRGFGQVLADVQVRGLPAEQVIVVVMDADGRLSDGAMAEVLPLFDDPTVGAAQLAVRIRNRSTNFLLRFQDHLFWTLSALSQFGRMKTSTVSLGGNGQFARLSALLEVGTEPWRASLTEDLDLSVSLAVEGWRLVSTPTAAVDQQGVESVRALVRQRTRWYQGHMMEARRLPEIFRSRRIGHAAAVEMTLYVMVPWIFDLPWSILYHIVLVELALDVGSFDLFSGGLFGNVLAVVVWYLLGFWPAMIAALLAKSRSRQLPWRDAVALGHAFLITNYMAYVCAWRALYRMVRGRNGWVKTERVADPAPSPAVLASAVPEPATELGSSAASEPSPGRPRAGANQVK